MRTFSLWLPRLCVGAATVLVLPLCRPDEPKQEELKAKKVSDSLSGLAPKDLPPATRAKPDPATQQYLREAVFVSFDERVQPESGDAFAPRVKVFEINLKEYLRRSGHPIVAAPAEAVYRIEGKFEAKHQTTLKVLGQATAWKYSGSSTIYVVDRDGKQLETLDVPELIQEHGKNEEYAEWNLERHMAKIQWDKLVLTGKTFTNATVVALIGSLVLQSDGVSAPTTEEITKKLAEIGFPAVPYLLEALTDTRSVRVPSAYPGLKGRSLDDLRVFHVADKALEEIFQKVSRMGIAIGAEDPESQKQRLVIIKGWENEWRRFCKPYSESSRTPSPRPPAAGSGNSNAPAKKSASEKGTPEK